jgi:hypothetical protein
MAGMEKSTARAVAVIALLFVTAWALRGYLPGNEQVTDRQRPPSSPAALIVDVVLLAISVAIIGFAIVARLRNPAVRRPGPGALPLSRGAVGRPTWRFMLIALAFVIIWLLLVMTLTRLGLGGPADHSPSAVPTTADPGTAAPTAANPAPPQPGSPEDTGPNVVNYLVAPMMILMALIVAGTVIASRRQRRLTPSSPAAGDVGGQPAKQGAAESLARAAEVGLAEIGDLSREPREAIIACYAAMERELTRVPGAAPLDWDTPSEVLARAVAHHALNADSATRLVELFEEARFSPHVMNEGHRDDAVDALRLVLADVRSMT